jgi:predicted DNA-binding transcriptional regulator AlpA
MAKLLKTGDVQKLLICSRATVVRYRRKLGFPQPMHFAGHNRCPAYYDEDEVLAWIEAHRPPKGHAPMPSDGPEPA